MSTEKPIKIAGRELTIHPAADEFPRLTGTDYSLLRDDIKANGLRNPIILFGKQVLDGRNRLQACIDSKVEPKFAQYRGTDPVGEVITQNILRRHLTDDQRVALVTKLRSADLEAEGKDNKAKALKGEKNGKGRAAERIAKEAKVTVHKGKAALAAAKYAPEDLDDVIRGKAKLAHAAKKANATKAAKSGKPAKASKVASLQERVEKKFQKFMESFAVTEYREVRNIVRTLVATADKKGQFATK